MISLGQVPRVAWARLERVGAWGAVGQGVLAVSGLAVTVAVARTGGPTALGTFALVQGLTFFLSQLLRASLGDPLVIEAHGQSRTDGLTIAGPIATAHLALGLAGALLWMLLADRVPGLPAPSPLGLLIVALLPLVCLHDLSRSLRLAGKGERHLVAGDLLVAVSRFAALALGLAGLKGLQLGLLATASGAVACVLSIRAILRGPWCLEPVARLWRLGRWVFGDWLLYGVTTYGVWLMYVPRAGVSAAGQLHVALQLFAPVQTILLGLNSVLLGRLASNGTGGRTVRSYVILQASLVAVWSTAVVGVGPRLSTLVFGDMFKPSRLDLLALAATMMAATAFEFAAVRLRALRQTRALIRSRITVAVIGLAGVALLGTSLLRLALLLLVAYVVGICVTQPRRSTGATPGVTLVSEVLTPLATGEASDLESHSSREPSIAT